MDTIKVWARRGWRWFRGRVWWQQALGWLIVASVIIGPFTNRKQNDDESKAPTTSQVVAVSASVTDPPVTSPESSAAAPETSSPATEPAETAAPETSPAITEPPVTLEPSTTSTPVTATPTTVSEQDRITERVSDDLEGGDLVSVELPDALITPDQITVTVASSEGFTEGLTKDAARLAVFSTLKGLSAASLDAAVTRFRVVVKYDLVDQFGAVTNSTVVDVAYERATVERIQFDNVNFTDILTLPTANLYVHPSFAKDDGS